MAPLSGLLGIMMLSGFMWVPRFCFLSEGALSSPQSLKVEVLDFHAKVFWEAGPGNPNNTTYVLELQKFGERNWTKIENCMTLLTCDLDDFESYDDLMKSYFIRVKAVWVNESSEWTNQSTFQPYESQFSPPMLNVTVQEGSIFVAVQHPVKVKGLKFAIYLYRNGSGQATELEAYWTAEGVHRYHNLPPDRYCLRAQLSNYLETREGLFAEECIVIQPDAAGEWSPWRVALGVPFLLVLPVTVILISVSCYLWPRPKYLRTPKPLTIKDERPNLLEVDPEKASTVEILPLTCDDANDLVPKHNEDNTSLKGDSTCTKDTSAVSHVGEIILLPKEEEDDPNMSTNSLCLSVNYRLASDSGDEDTKVEETPLHATYPNDTNDENEGNSNEYMERLMVGAQWQVHVPSNSSNRQSAWGSVSLESSDEDPAETPSNSQSDYIPRPPICHHSDKDSY